LLPRYFCWSRFGTEAGETAAEIFRRKEIERRSNGGLFLWGIGNALGPSIAALARQNATPEVLFSPILSKPRPKDVRPKQLIRWREGKDLNGQLFSIPRASVVTSGHGDGTKLRKRYALVCRAAEPICQLGSELLCVSQLYNFVSGNRVGASQVTAIVGLNLRNPPEGPFYRVAFRAKLVAPYFIELATPEIMWSPSRNVRSA